MSKNVVDSVIDFSLKYSEKKITFIPSRRQIDHNSGYVNEWTSSSFSAYVKSKNNNILLERDHGGPGQGYCMDDGEESLLNDCNYMDIIHIDPWKTAVSMEDGINKTICLLKKCYEKNPNILFEIGTEESIYSMAVNDVELLILSVKENVSNEIFDNIKYLVIQCGTKLKACVNTGEYNEEKLQNMLNICKKYNVIAKEHNGDWVSIELINSKLAQGLTNINIAPELAEIETNVLLEKIKETNNVDVFETLFQLCYESKRWEKWVSSHFNPFDNKEKIIQISAHYIYSTSEFIKIKQTFENIDTEMKYAIQMKLYELYNIFYERNQCIICESINISTLLSKNYESTLSLSLHCSKKIPSFSMPYNILSCNDCASCFTKYIGDLSIVYGTNHIDNYGTSKLKKHIDFCNFIIKNKKINGIVEVGSCNGELANNILEQFDTDYIIIEPSYIGNNKKIKIISDYIENIDLINLDVNTIVMSDVFEHFYNPLEILKKIKNSTNINYIYLNHPDFDFYVKNNYDLFLNHEHTFILEHKVMFDLFHNYGFELTSNYNYNNASLFLEFERIDILYQSISLRNISTTTDVKNHYKVDIERIQIINNYMSDKTKKYYIWPASIYTVNLFTYGLNYHLLDGILDNSPNKIGKYLYFYDLLCYSFNELLKTTDDNIVVFIPNTGTYVKELDLSNTKVELLFINDIV
jgi:hypothetical protein